MIGVLLLRFKRNTKLVEIAFISIKYCIKILKLEWSNIVLYSMILVLNKILKFLFQYVF